MSGYEPFVRNRTIYKERRKASKDGSSFQHLLVVGVVLKELEWTRTSAFRCRSTSGVDVGCVDGDVTEPCTDGVDVDAGAQQVCGCHMPDSVRADGSAEQRRTRS